MLLWDHVTYQTHYIFTCTRPMATKYGKVGNFYKGLPPINSYKFVLMWSHVKNWKYHISTITVFMFTRLIRVVTCCRCRDKQLAPVNWHDLWIRRSCKVTWQIKCIISLPAEHQWTPIRQSADLQWEASILKAMWPFDNLTNVGSLDSLKNIYLHYHKTSV